ncbi:class III lanthipeptide [Alkalihalobacillus sp. NPDC078783]
MARTDVLSLQSLKRSKVAGDPPGSNVSVNCKKESTLSIFFCVSPR